jgi:hypothetical protein
MYEYQKYGNEAGKELAVSINHAHRGELNEAITAQSRALIQIFSISDALTRKSAFTHALEVRDAWLGVSDKKVLVVEVTKATEPFWAGMAKPSSSANPTVFSVGRMLGDAISLSCHGKTGSARVAFDHAAKGLESLGNVGDCYEAYEYGLKTGYRGWESRAEIVSRDLVDAAKAVSEDMIDIGYCHLYQAAESIVQIPEDEDRRKAISMARQSAERTYGSKLYDQLALVYPLFLDSNVKEWDFRFFGALRDLVQPTSTSPVNFPDY